MPDVIDRLMSGTSLKDLALPPSLTVCPTGGPTGAVVEGVDLADDLPGDIVAALVTVFNHAGLMIVPGQNRLTPGRQAEVSQWFGMSFSRGAVGFGDGKDRIPNVNGGPVQFLANVDPATVGSTVSRTIGGSGPDYRLASRELSIHSDVQDYPIPPDLTILHGVEVPPHSAGGNTYFYNLYAAFEALEPDVRERIVGLRWRPRTPAEILKIVEIGLEDYLERERRGDPSVVSAEPNPVRHPVVRTHPVTGRRALWISPDMTAEIVGLDPAEGVELLDALLAHVADDRFAYTHLWTAHDVLFWDNRCVNHRRDAWDPSFTRVMHRAQAGGSRPF